jgi:anti-sigma regulatory factor (Ser/Thr protein kinase)
MSAKITHNMIGHLSILVPCRLSSRDIVGAMVHQICERIEAAGEPEGFGYQVISAFNEAFNNVVTHGGKGDQRNNLLVIIEVTDNQLIIELQDDGESFKLKDEIPNLDQLRESGMGLFIMRSFMDQLDYKPRGKDNANRLRMIRNLVHAKPSSSLCL